MGSLVSRLRVDTDTTPLAGLVARLLRTILGECSQREVLCHGHRRQTKGGVGV
jgi:hypothetical protein